MSVGNSKPNANYEAKYGFEYGPQLKEMLKFSKGTLEIFIEKILSLQPELFKEEYQEWSVMPISNNSAELVCYDVQHYVLHREILDTTFSKFICIVVNGNTIESFK